MALMRARDIRYIGVMPFFNLDVFNSVLRFTSWLLLLLSHGWTRRAMLLMLLSMWKLSMMSNISCMCVEEVVTPVSN